MSTRPRIGVTQRQVAVPGRDELRDALDVRLPALLWDLGFVPVPLANRIPDPRTYLDALALDGLVLSGGDDPGVTPERDRFEAAALDHAEAAALPVLAVCRGLQVLNLRAGGRLRPVDGHVATRHEVRGVLAPDGTVEAVRHANLPWTGVLWHPERDDPTDPADRALLRAVLAP